MSNEVKHTPGPWHLSRPLGTGHLEGKEPWFRVSADRTLFLDVRACSDGFVIGENEANALLIAAAPELLEALSLLLHDRTPWTVQCAEEAIARATGATP